MTELDERPAEAAAGGPPLLHCYCRVCGPWVAMCGHRPRTPVGRWCANPPKESRCVVCDELADGPCPRCGRGPW